MSKKSDALTNLKKARSFLSNMIVMHETGCCHLDIMQQNLAVIGLLRSGHRKLAEEHIDKYLDRNLGFKNLTAKQKALTEIFKVTNLTNK